MSEVSDPSHDVLASGAAVQERPAARGQAGRVWQQFRQRITEDWRGSRSFTLGLVLLLICGLITAAYYINHPTPETSPDTVTYLAVTRHIMTSGKFVDPIRTPGYPLMIALTFWVAGQGNLFAVSVVQGILFVVAALEVYVIACLLTRHAYGSGRLRALGAWVALIVGLLVGTNTYLLSFIKPVLSEGFSLWVVTSFALALVLFVRTLRVGYLWLVAAFALVAMMTRAEWDYGPVLIFAFMLLVAARRGRFRRLAPHALAAVIVLYGLLGLYVYENAALNGFAGVTDIERANLLGKVLQYDMQNEAPPQYAALIQEADAYRATGSIDPYRFATMHREVVANDWALAGAYATSIVERHPLEFVLKTIPVIFDSSNTLLYERSKINLQGPFGEPLHKLSDLSGLTAALYRFFPFIALFWLVLLFWPRIGRRPLVEMMGALSLIGLYELVLIALGGYSDYQRLHTAFDPLMLLVICASLLLALTLLPGLLTKKSSPPAAEGVLTYAQQRHDDFHDDQHDHQDF